MWGPKFVRHFSASFKTLTWVTITIIVRLDVTPCSLVAIFEIF